MTTFLPLALSGESSLTRAEATGNSPPSPKPVTNLNTTSIARLTESPQSRLPTL